jgi:hypothetical protein
MADRRLILSIPGSRRRRLGLGLMVYGAVGLAILALVLAFVAGWLGGDGSSLGLDAGRDQVVRLLDASEDALADAETASRNADLSLVEAADAASSAGGFMNELSGTMRELAASLRISIFGSQPFAAPADDFERVAGSAAAVAADLQTAATAVRLGGEDLSNLAAELSTMQDEVDRMRTAIDTTFAVDTSGWRLMAVVVVAWLAVPALVSLLVGYRWWRPSATRRNPAPSATGSRRSSASRTG